MSACLAMAMAVAGCGRTSVPAAPVTPAAGAELDAAAMTNALATLPEAERREAEEATAISLWGVAPAPDEAELAPFRTKLVEAHTLLGFSPAYRNEAELVPYLASLVRAK